MKVDTLNPDEQIYEPTETYYLMETTFKPRTNYQKINKITVFGQTSTLKYYSISSTLPEDPILLASYHLHDTLKTTKSY